MDQDQMEQAGPVQCRNGCGFYSNAGTDGLCSVCYKDCIKKKQQPPTNMPASLVPTSMAPSGNGSSSSPPQMTSLSIGDEMANAITSSVPSSSPTLTNSNKSGPISVETGSPTVILPSSSSTLQTEKVSIRILFWNNPKWFSKYIWSFLCLFYENILTHFQRNESELDPLEAIASASTASALGTDTGAIDDGSANLENPESGKKKKNRCFNCKKKVGLTGKLHSYD